MPIYEYICEQCGKEIERLQKITEEALRDCPHCGKASLRKKISAVGFQLKGTGWYVTDFKDKPKESAVNAAKTTEKGEVVDTAKASSSDESKKDTKQD